MEILVLIGVISVVFFLGYLRYKETTKINKVSKLQLDIIELRQSINEFYKNNGIYPNLIGNEDELEKVVAGGNQNNTLRKERFTEYYKKNKLPETPGFNNVMPSNKIIEVNYIIDLPQNIKVSDLGGWLYDSRTGEIHANIIGEDGSDPFGNGIDWRSE